MRLPNTLVSLGRTMWVVVAKVSFAVRVFGAMSGGRCCPAKVGFRTLLRETGNTPSPLQHVL